jgi:hypothetical protein
VATTAIPSLQTASQLVEALRRADAARAEALRLLSRLEVFDTYDGLPRWGVGAMSEAKALREDLVSEEVSLAIAVGEAENICDLILAAALPSDDA